MKKTMVFIFIFALILCALTGCGSRGNDEQNQSGTTPSPEVTVSPRPVKPEDNNGKVEDDNGIIGDNSGNSTDTDVPQDGVLPEIGQDIENGTNDVIDEVGDAIQGNDNNAGSNSRGRNSR